jgi:hypothetical protein
MLSWSSNEMGGQVDLTAVAAGADEIGIDNSDVLVRFATACAERDDIALDRARDALSERVDPAFMVDAAAVAANFEMMTRLADSTGAAMPPERIERSAGAIGAMGAADFTSRR